MTDAVNRLKAVLADRYAIERELGRGGMATVYLAEDLKHHRKVAIKVLHPALAATIGPDRFLREIEIAAGLQHPHILGLLDSGQADGHLYYVMPFVKGESLREKLVRERELPVREAARILRDVADALAHAHEAGVVHRDIKPENVMLSGRHALVTDFGVAKAISEATGRQQLTTAGVALGTPAYMAPEQAAADPKTDHRADIYALGVLAYELLTGDPPFGGSSPQAILSAHVTKAPAPVAERREVPSALAELVMKCLKKKPADRWQRAEELIPIIEATATPSGGVAATDTNRFAVTKPWSRRGRLAAAIVIPLAIGIAASVWRAGGRLGRPASTDGVRLAVVPFENRGRPEDEFFSDGISDAIRGEVQRIPGFVVIGRQTSMQFKGQHKSLRDIGDALRVDYVLTGTTEWDGQTKDSSRVRVNPELVRVADETSRWQESYVVVYRDIFAVQSDIARNAAQAVSGSIVRSPVVGSSAVSARRRPANLEAYTLYLRGTAEWLKFTPEGRRLAVDYLERAIRADSTYAPSWAELAFILSADGRAKAMAQRALQIDSTSAEAYLALAGIELHQEWDFAAAERYFRRALELNPQDGFAAGVFSAFLADVGRNEEALSVGRSAATLDPLASGDMPLYPLFALGKYRDVIRLADSGLAVDPADTPNGFHRFRGYALLELGRFSEALDALSRWDVRVGGKGIPEGWALARAGRTPQARALLEQHLRDLEKTEQGPARLGYQLDVAALYANLARPDSAFLWLERTLPFHAGRALVELRWRPEWDPIRSDPRFKELLKKIGLEK